MQLDLASGERIWTAPEGAMSPTWVSGNSVFQISDQNELLRLDAATGERVWGVQLPYFTNERVRRRRAIYDHYGPVLAGGRLVVLSGDGEMRLFNPDTGGALGSVPIPGGAASLPAIVGGTMYLVSGSGQLHAFR
jgi:outer membrane protein assembly factor BamB